MYLRNLVFILGDERGFIYAHCRDATVAKECINVIRLGLLREAERAPMPAFSTDQTGGVGAASAQLNGIEEYIVP
jgi:hypothetical protein